MRFEKKHCLNLFAGLLMAVPGWAAHTNSISWGVSSPTTIGGIDVQPGVYLIRVEDGGSQLEVESHGKSIAQIPVHWTQLGEKAPASKVEIEGGKVTQIKIGGKASAISFQN